ncbi:MAG: hypothetical protein WD770_07460 [Actinomycetota bacterium]
MTGRASWATTLLLVSVLLFGGAAVLQVGRDAESLVGTPALVLLGLAVAFLIAGILTLGAAFRARRRLRERLGTKD